MRSLIFLLGNINAFTLFASADQGRRHNEEETHAQSVLRCVNFGIVY